jgi:Mg2+-importing ATPase
MLIFGPLSSAFDFATFGVLFWLSKSNEQVFHTGWLRESILSASPVVFIVRSRQSVTQSRPGKAMMLVTGLMALLVLILPYNPFAGALELVPLPAGTILILFGIVTLYIIAAEITKHWFFK